MKDRSSQATEDLARDGGVTGALTPGKAHGHRARKESKAAEREARRTGRAARRVRSLARLAVVAQVTFVASWLLAAAWQGPRYSVLAHSISDMYAQTAPGGAFLVVMFTLCGAATIWFAWRSLRTALRPGGWLAATGSALLALSVFGLGDLLSVSEREACRLADPGCTSTSQLANFGGTMDGTLSTVGIVLFIIGGFFLAAAMKRAEAWQSWVRPVRWSMVLMIVLFICDGIANGTGLSGLAERLIALTGATEIALVAVGVSRRSRSVSH